MAGKTATSTKATPTRTPGTLGRTATANRAPANRTMGGEILDDYRSRSRAGKAAQILLDPVGLFSPGKVNPQYLGGSPEAFAAQQQQYAELGDVYRQRSAEDAAGLVTTGTGSLGRAEELATGTYGRAARVGTGGRLISAGGRDLSSDAAAVRAGGVTGQDAAIGGMLRAAQVRTPSLAEARARAGVQQVQQQALSQAAGASNQALATRNAVQAGAGAAAQVANQQAALRAQEEALRQQRIVQAYEAAGQQYGQRVGVGFGAQAQGLGAQAQGAGVQLGALGAQNQAAGTVAGAGSVVGQLGLGQQRVYEDSATDQQQLALQGQIAQLGTDEKAEAARSAQKGGALGRIGKALGGLFGGGGGLFGGK